MNNKELDDTSILYHYTSVDGLMGIITKNTFWATSIYHLNDSSEFQYGFRIARSVLEQKEQNAKKREQVALLEQIGKSLTQQGRWIQVYVTCFCQEDNLLSMWRAYGSKGYCLGINLDAIKARLNDSFLGNSNTTLSLKPVEYDTDKQIEQIAQKVDEALEKLDKISTSETDKLAADVAIDLIWLFPEFKDAAFREEKEWRLIKRFVTKQEIEEAKFRGADGMLVPFIEMDSFQSSNGKLPLTSIRFGPLLPQEPTEKAIRLLLHKHDYGQEVKIEPSGIPLR